jgi:asparagine synthase (glutamine-hydrolysing)
MCGISGIINKNSDSVNSYEIGGMNALISHRGPDSEDYYFCRNFAFGHRRLKIIDLSANASQPMTYLGRYTITYNGEIYNYLEIREDLLKKGYHFTTASDTEVILAAYDYYGFDCVTRFNGMWAFALYDNEKELIFCSRDRFGVKPFYYSDNSHRFIFGSEIKQILYFQDKKYVNQQILIDYLIPGFEEHTNDTFYQNVQKLEQSHNLIYSLRTNTFVLKKYYEIKIHDDISKLSESESAELYRTVLTNSINLRLRSDVKVGTCLSGGLDSSTVATLASSSYRLNSSDKFMAITAKSTEPELDESYFAGMVADYAGLDWHVISPSFDEFVKRTEKIITLQEEPFGSPSVFMQYLVFEKAKELGCTVMLDGQGGDETLLGYERYYPAYLLSMKGLDRFTNFINSSKNSGITKRNLFLYYIYFTLPTVRIRKLKARFSFVRAEYFKVFNSDNIKKSSDSYHDLINLQKLELKSLQLPHLLKYEDRNSMFHSVEARLPFIDYNVVETALSIKNSFKIKDGWTKFILRKSMEGRLPDKITWRKSKLGFNAPEKTWLNSTRNEIYSSLIQSEILMKISNKDQLSKMFANLEHRTIWRLYNIAKWEKLFDVRFS